MASFDIELGSSRRSTSRLPAIALRCRVPPRLHKSHHLVKYPLHSLRPHTLWCSRLAQRQSKVIDAAAIDRRHRAAEHRRQRRAALEALEVPSTLLVYLYLCALVLKLIYNLSSPALMQSD